MSDMKLPIDARWKVRRRSSEVQRRPWLEVFKETIELPDGRLVHDFYSVEMQEFVVVVAVTLAADVVVESLYRHGPARITWSLPAGYLHPGEGPLAAAIRELREETGYEAANWSPLGHFIVDGNRGCGWCHCFIAQRAERTVDPRSDDLAATEVVIMSLERLLELLAAGDVVELASAAAIGLAAIRLGAAGPAGEA